MASPYRIQIPIFEGPLDLLLDLIKKQEMNIHDIQISKITSQYLDYLHQLEQLNVDVSAEFIYMAATLIYIKSKMLPHRTRWPVPRSRLKTRAKNLSSASWSTKNSRTPPSFSTRGSKSRKTSGPNRTSPSTTTKVRKENSLSLSSTSSASSSRFSNAKRKSPASNCNTRPIRSRK